MAKHNYSQYSAKKNFESASEAVETNEAIVANEPDVVDSTVNVTASVEPVEVKMEPETVTGVVSNCARLNVRAEASKIAEVVCVLNAGSEIKIDVAKSTDEWHYVCTTSGIEGYCMKSFVNVCL